jgi:hypothetical protein
MFKNADVRTNGAAHADALGPEPVPICSVCSQLISQFSETANHLHVKSILLAAVAMSGDHVLSVSILAETRQLKSECDSAWELLKCHRSERLCTI